MRSSMKNEVVPRDCPPHVWPQCLKWWKSTEDLEIHQKMSRSQGCCWATYACGEDRAYVSHACLGGGCNAYVALFESLSVLWWALRIDFSGVNGLGPHIWP